MAQLAPNDVVPELRPDLAFSGSPQGLGDGLLSVTNVTNGEELRLRGFECSLARMLDGHRTAREVVAAASSLGLPLTLGGLDGFVKTLRSLDLIDGRRRRPAGASAWIPRQRWDEETREQYREALREGRTGHLDQASVAVSRLLEKDPHLVEARTLREGVEARHPGAERPQAFLDVFADAERGWLAQGETVDLEAVQPSWRKRRAELTFWLAIAGLVLLVLAATVVPLPHTLRVSAELAPISSARIVAPRTGTVANVRVSLGQLVEKNQVLFSYELGATVAALRQAVDRLEQQRHELDAARQGAVSSEEAEQRVAEAEAEVARATGALDEARRASGDPFSEAVTVPQAELYRKLAELQNAQLELEAKRPAQLLATVRRLEAEIAKLEQELVNSDVRAPVSGQVGALAVRDGQPIFVGMDAVRIDDRSQLKVVATVDPEEAAGIALGQPVELVTRGRRVATTVSRLSQREIEVLIDNTARTLEPGPVRMEIRGEPRPPLRLP